MFQNLWYQMGRTVVDFYVRAVMRADIHLEGALPKGAKIIAANHPSTNDPAFVTILTREHNTILIKETLFKVPWFGRSLRLSGHVPVLAGNGRAALEEGIRRLKAGRTVVIFPEGEISPEGGFHKAHTGVARLALATGAPVIPVGISLDQKKVKLVHTQVEGQDETGTWYLRGPYAMTVGKPMVFQGSAEDREQVRAVTSQIMQHIDTLHHHGHLRLKARRAAALAPRLGMAHPKASFQVAWKATELTFQQSAQLLLRTAVVHWVESRLLFLLMYARNI